MKKSYEELSVRVIMMSINTDGGLQVSGDEGGDSGDFPDFGDPE